MHLSAKGWARNHGSHDLKSVDLENDAKIGGRFYHHETTISELPGIKNTIGGLNISFGTTVKMGGDYQINLRLSRADIFLLFYLANQRAGFSEIIRRLYQVKDRISELKKKK